MQTTQLEWIKSLSIIGILALPLGLLASCQSSTAPVETGAPPPPVSHGRWTPDFLNSALLIADTIRIEGPPALRIHMALPQDAVALETKTKATNHGLLHVFTVRPDSDETVKAILDKWQIVATKRLEVLERPNETDVTITARGEAAWLPTLESEGVQERRGAELLFVGKLER
ncbi:MAG: hypothetical protein ACI8TQ_000225 [Planctomycetota bacterium]|jgi:hypothetical protein